LTVYGQLSAYLPGAGPRNDGHLPGKGVHTVNVKSIATAAVVALVVFVADQVKARTGK